MGKSINMVWCIKCVQFFMSTPYQDKRFFGSLAIQWIWSLVIPNVVLVIARQIYIFLFSGYYQNCPWQMAILVGFQSGIWLILFCSAYLNEYVQLSSMSENKLFDWLIVKKLGIKWTILRWILGGSTSTSWSLSCTGICVGRASARESRFPN